MRELGLRLSTLVALLVVAGPVGAADKSKPVPEGGAVQVVLLRQPSVCQELKLTDGEKQKIRDFTNRQWEKAKRLESASADEQDRQFAQMEQENEQFVAQTLTPGQRQRLNEITLQVAGLLWLSRAQIEAELNLTPEQRQKVKQLQAEAKREMQDVLHGDGGGDKHAKLRELRQTNRKRLLEVLDDRQEAKWKQISGAPFNGDLTLQD